jgi:hypothetical protein
LKVITFIERSGVVAYVTVVILAIIFNVLGFAIINTVIINVLKVLYFVILICAIIAFYKSEKKNIISIILFFLPIMLLFTGIPFKEVTMILLLPLFFLKGIKVVIRGIGISMYMLLIILGFIGILLGDFGFNGVIDQQYSPNGVYRTVTINSDMGALGGDTYVKSEEIYFGIIKRNIKTLYHGNWGEKPEVKWVDNSTVKINGRDMNIHTSSTWENRH